MLYLTIIDIAEIGTHIRINISEIESELKQIGADLLNDIDKQMYEKTFSAFEKLKTLEELDELVRE